MAEVKHDNYLQISFWKALSILATSVLVTIVGTAFAVGGVLNSDHFTLVSAIEDIDRLEEEKVDQDVYDLQQEAILKQLKTLNTNMEKVLIEVRN